MAIPSVNHVTGSPYISQIVTTSNGRTVAVPNYLGSTIFISPNEDGTYEVTTKPTKMGEPFKVENITEEELLDRYEKKPKLDCKI